MGARNPKSAYLSWQRLEARDQALALSAVMSRIEVLRFIAPLRSLHIPSMRPWQYSGKYVEDLDLDRPFTTEARASHIELAKGSL